MSVLELKSLVVGYGEPLCNNVSFIVEKGDKVLLKGLNGAGKSTLIRTICGLKLPLGGTILLQNKPVGSLELPRLVTERFSVLLTNGLDAAGLKVSEYFEMHSSKLNKEEVRLLIELFDVKKLLNKDMSEISDGEKQKVLLIKSISKLSHLYLFDEPTTFLDYKTKEMFYEYVSKCTEKTFLISTHDIEKMSLVANKTVLL